MKKVWVFLMVLCFVSCIPLKYAPNIEDYDVVVAKKFKSDLPKRHAFVFEDRNDTEIFMQFIYWKFGRIDMDLKEDIPFDVDGQTYYMTFYERPRESASLNLLPLLIDGEVMGEELYDSDGEYWYILITVTDSELRDCLNPAYPDQKKVIYALSQLKEAYMNSDIYGGASSDQE